MAARLLNWIHSDRRIAQYAIGVTGAFICGGYLLPHGVFLHRYKCFVQAYKDGVPVRLSDTLRRHVDAVLDDSAVEEDERRRLRFFTAFGADLFHAGSTSLRWGAVIGLPQTFLLNSDEDAAASGFMVAGKKVDWQSAEGRLLGDGIRLSPAAQRFAIARELWHACSLSVWVDGCLGAGMLFVTYSLGRVISGRMGFTQRPRTLRVMLYTMVSLFGVGLWVTTTDMVQHYRDSQSDMAAAQLGPAYAWGGVEFYEKTLERNRALRRLDPASGERMFTAYGNEKTVLRAPRMAITERLETLRTLCDREHPRNEVQRRPTAAAGTSGLL